MSRTYENEWQQMSHDFHKVMRLPNGRTIAEGVASIGIIDGRLTLEEPVETVFAMFGRTITVQLLVEAIERVLALPELPGTMNDRLPEIIDGIGDQIYIATGRAAKLGVDMAPIMRRIHAANMAKVGGPIINQKQAKPPGWTPPDIACALREQGWEG